MRYRCELSDTAPGAYTVPIRSFQLRYRQSPRQCYLSVVVPSGLTYGDEIVLRKGGTVAVYEVADDDSETELLVANIDSISVDEGSVNRAITIVGYKQTTFPGTGSYEMEAVTYASTDRVRGKPVRDLRPQDDLTAHGDTFTAEEIVWTVNSSGRTMEVSGYTPALLKLLLAADAGITVAASPTLRPSAISLDADALATTEFVAPINLRISADSAFALAASGQVSMQSLLEADAAVAIETTHANLQAGSYAGLVEALSPIGYWRLTENSTTTFANTGSLGSTYDATLEIKDGQSGRETYRTPQYAACVPSMPTEKGLWMNYYWHLVVDGGFPSIDSTMGDFTIGFWFKPESSYEFYSYVCGREVAAGGSYAFMTNARMVSARYKVVAGSSFGGVGTFDDGDGHFFCLVRYFSTTKLYVDNVELTEYNAGTAGSVPTSQGTQPLYLMGIASDDYGYNGTMQEFFILDYGISTSDRTALYNAGIGA